MTIEKAKVEPILCVVHPGGCCVTANHKLGRNNAREARSEMATTLEEWSGGIIIIDDSNSAEVADYSDIDEAINEAIDQAEIEKQTALRIFACKEETPHWETVLETAISALGLSLDTRFTVTGAWHFNDGSDGAVNAVFDILEGLGFRTIIDGSVFNDPDGDDDEEPELNGDDYIDDDEEDY